MKRLFYSLLALLIVVGCARTISDLILKVGNGTDADVKIEMELGKGASNPYLNYDTINDKFQFCNEGAACEDMGSGGGAPAASSNTMPVIGNKYYNQRLDGDIKLPVRISKASLPLVSVSSGVTSVSRYDVGLGYAGYSAIAEIDSQQAVAQTTRSTFTVKDKVYPRSSPGSDVIQADTTISVFCQLTTLQIYESEALNVSKAGSGSALGTSIFNLTSAAQCGASGLSTITPFKLPGATDIAFFKMLNTVNMISYSGGSYTTTLSIDSVSPVPTAARYAGNISDDTALFYDHSSLTLYAYRYNSGAGTFDQVSTLTLSSPYCQLPGYDGVGTVKNHLFTRDGGVYIPCYNTESAADRHEFIIVDLVADVLTNTGFVTKDAAFNTDAAAYYDDQDYHSSMAVDNGQYTIGVAETFGGGFSVVVFDDTTSTVGRRHYIDSLSTGGTFEHSIGDIRKGQRPKKIHTSIGSGALFRWSGNYGGFIGGQFRYYYIQGMTSVFAQSLNEVKYIYRSTYSHYYGTSPGFVDNVSDQLTFDVATDDTPLYSIGLSGSTANTTSSNYFYVGLPWVNVTSTHPFTGWLGSDWVMNSTAEESPVYFLGDYAPMSINVLSSQVEVSFNFIPNATTDWDGLCDAGAGEYIEQTTGWYKLDGKCVIQSYGN